MANEVTFRTANGTPQYPQTLSSCVYDPVSGAPIDTQINKMAKDIAELKESGITIESKENLRVASTISAINGEDCYYTRISAGRKYRVSVSINGDYSRVAVTSQVPAKNVETYGYLSGGKGTAAYSVIIDMAGNGKTVNLSTGKESEFIVNPTDDFYLAISFKRDMVNSFDIEYYKDEEEDSAGGPGYLSIEKQLENIKFMRDKFGATTLLWFTDAHAISADKRWTPQLEKAMKWANENAQYIDDVLHTGDTVQSYAADWDENIWIGAGAERVLNVVGNHDVLVNGGSEESASNTYAKYYAPFVSSWGVTHDGDTSHCYYYKDYPNGIRLIVLDQQHGGSAQLTWLQGVLASARTGNKHVVIAGHYQPDESAIKMATAFTSTKDNFGFRPLSGVIDAVDAYIEAGGVFVCWLVGHTHTDFITKLENHHNQIVICQDCLACRIDATADRNRVTNTDSELCMNLITFNTVIPNKNNEPRTITISRVGFEYDMYNRHRGMVCIDYSSGEIMGEW